MSITALRILTWNTDMSPSMYGRLKRKRELLERIATYNGNYDVICFQELTSFAVGRLTFALFRRFASLFERSPSLVMIWDYLMIGEGLIYPYAVIDNQLDVIEAARRLGFEHSIQSPLPRRYINSGLVILSRFPIVAQRTIVAPSDMVHRPMTILAELDVHGKTLHIGSSYFVPDLLEPKPSYIICNILRILTFRRAPRLRKIHLRSIKQMVRGKRVVLVGDFNIRRTNGEYKRMLEALELDDACQEEVRTHRGLFNNHSQIDYILISKNIRNLGTHADHREHISDHYPLYAELELL